METLMLLAGFFLLNFYIVSSIRFWLKTAGVNTKLHHWDIILAVLFCVTALVPIGGAFLPDSSLKWNLQEWGNLWHGILGYGALLLLISRIIW
ncbi:MAG: hypothetical protein EOM64_07270, partial [Erysipelotrichia bacterium]|nr:hypothetical protein [Erysipelotrichia bacterium]